MARSVPMLVRDLLDFLYPPVCVVCDRSPLDSVPLCECCERGLGRLPWPVCPRCRSFVTAGLRCPSGHGARPPLVWALGLFDTHYRPLIHAFKFQNRKSCGDYLGSLLAAKIAADPRSAAVGAVVPVPLHPTRRRERGFNQSERLGGQIAATLGVPVVPRGLRRVRNTKSQTRLSPDLRRRNVAGAFRADSRSVAGRALLVVDDVLTTGATLQECSRTLAAAGATGILGAVLALADS